MIPGRALDDCEPFTGDEIAHRIRWKTPSGDMHVAGKTVRIRFVLDRAKLYALRFA